MAQQGKAWRGVGLGLVRGCSELVEDELSKRVDVRCRPPHCQVKNGCGCDAMRCAAIRYLLPLRYCARAAQLRRQTRVRVAAARVLRGYSQSTGRMSLGRGGGQRLTVVFGATAADQLLRVLDLRSGTRLRDAVCDHLAAEAVASVARCMRHVVRPRAVMLAFRPPTRSDPPCACDARGMGAQACITYCVPY